MDLKRLKGICNYAVNLKEGVQYWIFSIFGQRRDSIERGKFGLNKASLIRSSTNFFSWLRSRWVYRTREKYEFQK